MQTPAPKAGVREAEQFPTPTLTQLQNDLVAVGVTLPDPGDEVGEQFPPHNTATPAVLVNGGIAATAAVGDMLACTMGEWSGAPDSYAYQWRRDGADLTGVTAADYQAVAADAGHALDCVVTATNAQGSTAGPPSNVVAVNGGATRASRSK